MKKLDVDIYNYLGEFLRKKSGLNFEMKNWYQ